MKLNPTQGPRPYMLALYKSVMPSPFRPSKLIPKRKLDMYELSLLNILKSKLKNISWWISRKKSNLFSHKFNLKKTFPSENEFLEIALSMTKLIFYFQKRRFHQGRECKNIWAGAVFQGQKESKDYTFLTYNYLPHKRRGSPGRSLWVQSRWFVIFWTKWSRRRADDGAA